VSILGLPLVGWNRKCIETIVEGAGKMVGYDITSVSQGSLMSKGVTKHDFFCDLKRTDIADS
jgi:hypothetical protein